MNTVKTAFDKLEDYIESEHFMGYDPYDTLNSWIPFHWFGKWGPIIATQIQKRNPINIRPMLGIKKGINPKAFGLFLQAYSLLYKKTNKKEYLDKADYFFEWLKNNYSRGYSGYCWGYNFPWSNPSMYKEKYTPSSVVTGFVCKGLYEYFKITKSKKAKDILLSASNFIIQDIPVTDDEKGICFSYTPLKRDLCFNSSLLAAEILAKSYTISSMHKYRDKAIKAVEWVIAHQKEDGRWNYSIDIHSGSEYQQIDFHQGYIIDSIYEIKKLLQIENDEWEKSIKNGLNFYKNVQFSNEGVSYWRYPKRWPVEIHNQAQGIITFAKMAVYKEGYNNFAKIIADWTAKNMQANDGHFYYQKFRYYTNKISYMRWSNAWMFLSLIHLLENV